jgi:DNA polymerase III epsilon subunit-like protein
MRIFSSGKKRPRALKDLVAQYFHQQIQTGEHNSVEDAHCAMKLYLLKQYEWEQSLRNKHYQHTHNNISEQNQLVDQESVMHEKSIKVVNSSSNNNNNHHHIKIESETRQEIRSSLLKKRKRST